MENALQPLSEFRATLARRCFGLNPRILKSGKQDETFYRLVVNPEPLSLSEALRIRSKLAGVGLAIDRVLASKSTAGSDIETLRQLLNDRPLVCYPLSFEQLCGVQAMLDYLKKHPEQAS